MQAWAWSVGFAGLALLIAFAAMIAARGNGIVLQRRDRRTPVMARPRVWAALAAIPAGLVIAVTAYISTDIAAAPLLWVLPLALYLLTFVAVFRDEPWFSHDLVLKVVPFVVAPLAITLLGGDRDTGSPPWRSICSRCSCWRSPAMARPYARRPAPALLTQFDRTSFRGVLGGMFAGLLRRPVRHHLRISDPGAPLRCSRYRRAARTAARFPVARLARARGRSARGASLHRRLSSKWPPGVTLQVVLVMLVVSMLLQRRNPARSRRLRSSR